MHLQATIQTKNDGFVVEVPKGYRTVAPHETIPKGAYYLVSGRQSWYQWVGHNDGCTPSSAGLMFICRDIQCVFQEALDAVRAVLPEGWEVYKPTYEDTIRLTYLSRNLPKKILSCKTISPGLVAFTIPDGFRVIRSGEIVPKEAYYLQFYDQVWVRAMLTGKKAGTDGSVYIVQDNQQILEKALKAAQGVMPEGWEVLTGGTSCFIIKPN